MSYPTSIDSIPQPTATSATNNPSASGVSVAQTTAIVALETKLGIGASTPATGDVLTSTANGTSTWATPSANVSNSGTPTSGQIAQWTSATVIKGLATTGTGDAVLATSPAITTPTGIVANDVGLGNVNNTSDATKLAATLHAIYPVGALYFSASVSTSPATILGFGTWTAIGGYTLVGFLSADTNFGTTGVVAAGEKTHTLITAEMPSHAHNIGSSASATTGGTGELISTSFSNQISSNVTGGGGAHNNIQPSFVVYIWYRAS